MLLGLATLLHSVLATPVSSQPDNSRVHPHIHLGNMELQNSGVLRNMPQQALESREQQKAGTREQEQTRGFYQNNVNPDIKHTIGVDYGG